MSFVVTSFFSFPFAVRVAVILIIVIFVFGNFLGDKFLWILSVIPLALRLLLRYVYLLVEFSVDFIHRRVGGAFANVDNSISAGGKKIDSALLRWYRTWHFPKKISLRRFIITYVVCLFVVVVPSLAGTDNRILNIGERVYLEAEAKFVLWLERIGWYDLDALEVVETEESIENESLESNIFEIVLTADVESSLLIRSVPSTEEGDVIGRLYSGETVVWKGEMTFGEADGVRVEPWVKVTTPDGQEGWCRLYYLYPEGYEGMKLYVTN